MAFYSLNTEPDHAEFAKQALVFFAREARRQGFVFESTTDWNDLNESNLKSYQVVVWLDGEAYEDSQRRAFQKYMDAGGAWLGFHVSGYNDQDVRWPWFTSFLGGAVFSINSWPPLAATLRVEDRTYPMTEGMPRSYESPANEWYLWNPDPRQNKDVRVIMSLSPSNYPLGLKESIIGGDLPVVWTNVRYKMLYINMGHGDHIFDSSIQNAFFEKSLLWLGGACLTSSPAAPNRVREPAGRLTKTPCPRLNQP